MIRRISILAAAAFAMCSPAAAQAKCPPDGNKDATVQDIVDCLGAQTIIKNADIWYFDANGVEQQFEYNRLKASVTPMVTPGVAYCATSDILDTQTAGSYTYKWCASYTELQVAKRDKWRFSNGRLEFKVTDPYSCSVALQRAAMPPAVQAAVCP